MEMLEAGIEDVDVGFSPGVDDPGGKIMEKPGGIVVELLAAICPMSSPISNSEV